MQVIFRKIALELKKTILSEGISYFENDKRYIELFHCKEIITNSLQEYTFAEKIKKKRKSMKK
jgi:hypothetical protein